MMMVLKTSISFNYLLILNFLIFLMTSNHLLFYFFFLILFIFFIVILFTSNRFHCISSFCDRTKGIESEEAAKIFKQCYEKFKQPDCTEGDEQKLISILIKTKSNFFNLS